MSDYHTYVAQAALITKLNEDNRLLLEKVQRLERKIKEDGKPAKFYLDIQKAAINDDMVMNAWREFLVSLKMSNEYEKFDWE